MGAQHCWAGVGGADPLMASTGTTSVSKGKDVLFLGRVGSLVSTWSPMTLPGGMQGEVGFENPVPP